MNNLVGGNKKLKKKKINKRINQLINIKNFFILNK